MEDEFYEYLTCDSYSHFLGFSNDQERDAWLAENGTQDFEDAEKYLPGSANDE